MFMAGVFFIDPFMRNEMRISFCMKTPGEGAFP